MVAPTPPPIRYGRPMTNLDRNLAREHPNEARGGSATAEDSDTLTALIRSLTLVETGTDRFQTALPVEKWQRLFGGEIFAQALTAASHTVAADRIPHSIRSEEHTSELQSLMRISYAVFCLKKKNNTKTN